MQVIGTSVSQSAFSGWVSNGESVCAQLPVIEVPKDSVLVFIYGVMTGNPGAGTASVTLNIRRGPGPSSPLVLGSGAVAVTANTQLCIPFMASEILSGVATVQYSLTATGAGMSGSGNFTNCSLAVLFMA
jgi:hypothetical protein